MQKIKFSKINCLLLAIIGLGLILRIYNLASESLWYDEVRSIEYIKHGTLTILFRPYSNPPLYFILLKMWSGLFGTNASAVRSLSVIFGILSILLIFKIGRIFFDEPTALFSAFILSISPLHIFYSQEARNFALSVFLSLLTILSFFKLFKTPKLLNYFYFTLTTILFLMTHYYAIFFLICFNIYFFIRIKNRKELIKWLISQSIILLFLLPFLYILIKNIDNIRKYGLFWINKPVFLPTLIDTLRTFSYGGRSFGGGDIFLEPKLLKIPEMLFYLFLILFIIALISPLKKQVKTAFNRFFNKSHDKNFNFGFTSNGTFFTLLWLCVPIAMPLLFSIIFFPIYIIRHTIMVAPAFYLLVAKGINNFFKKTYLQILIVIIIICLSLPMLSFYYKNDLKVPWDEIVSCLNKKMTKETLVVYFPPDRELTMQYYFPDNEYIEIKALEDDIAKDKEKGLANIKDRDIVLIDFNPRWGQPLEVNSIQKYLENHWLKTSGDFFGGVYVAYYEYHKE